MLGDTGVAVAWAATTSTPALKPTVTVTLPFTDEYVLLLASVNVTVAMLLMTVPSVVWP